MSSLDSMFLLEIKQKHNKHNDKISPKYRHSVVTRASVEVLGNKTVSTERDMMYREGCEVPSG